MSTLLSCLGDDVEMGMIDSSYGHEICQKGVDLMKYGGVWPSKECFLQDNHQCWNRPKDLRVMVPIWQNEGFDYD